MNVRTHTANVLVIGSGGAGMRAAIAAHRAGAEVVVVGKRPRLDAHTVLASGGINAALGTRDPEDSWQQHFADTLAEGYLLGDPRVVEIVVREAPAAVEELAEWGCGFARTEDGRIDQRFFGAIDLILKTKFGPDDGWNMSRLLDQFDVLNQAPGASGNMRVRHLRSFNTLVYAPVQDDNPDILWAILP